MDVCTLACEHCSFVLEDMLPAIIDSGFWPGNVARRHQYLFSKKVFDLFDLLHKVLPGTSVSGFLHTLEEVSALNGRVRVVNCTIIYQLHVLCVFHSSLPHTQIIYYISLHNTVCLCVRVRVCVCVCVCACARIACV